MLVFLERRFLYHHSCSELLQDSEGRAKKTAEFRAHNSAVECVLHTDEVVGSIPTAPTPKSRTDPAAEPTSRKNGATDAETRLRCEPDALRGCVGRADVRGGRRAAPGRRLPRARP